MLKHMSERSNRITALKKDDGSIVTSQEELETEAMDFYSKLFTRQEELDPGPILNCVQERVTWQMITNTETGFTHGGEPPLVPVFHPGASIRDGSGTGTKGPPLVSVGNTNRD